MLKQVVESVNHHQIRGGEFSTGETGSFHPALTEGWNGDGMFGPWEKASAAEYWEAVERQAGGISPDGGWRTDCLPPLLWDPIEPGFVYERPEPTEPLVISAEGREIPQARAVNSSPCRLLNFRYPVGVIVFLGGLAMILGSVVACLLVIDDRADLPLQTPVAASKPSVTAVTTQDGTEVSTAKSPNGSENLSFLPSSPRSSLSDPPSERYVTPEHHPPVLQLPKTPNHAETAFALDLEEPTEEILQPDEAGSLRPPKSDSDLFNARRLPAPPERAAPLKKKLIKVMSFGLWGTTKKP